jgi:acylphosphatase
MIEEASGRGLDGWVRNRRDGSVEAVLSGPEDAVEAMLEACWRGPSAARVAAVRVGSEDQAVAPGFRQRQSSGK